MNKYYYYYIEHKCSFLIQQRDIIVDKRTYQPYTLVGPPVWWPVLNPLAAYTLTTVYIYNSVSSFMSVYEKEIKISFKLQSYFNVSAVALLCVEPFILFCKSLSFNDYTIVNVWV